SDGAACLLLATEEWLLRRKWTGPVTWLESVGYATDAHYIGDRTLIENEALRQAATQAYNKGGIQNPAQAINCMEISAPFAHQIPLWLEELQVRADKNEPLKATLNASGGLMGARPGFASGLIRILEIANQLRGKEGKLGLAHGTHGPLGQAQCV